MRKLDVVCPVYQEREVISVFHERLVAVLEELSDQYAWRVLYVLDPSPDGTELELTRIAETDPRVGVLVMSRRFGHQAALLAGMDAADADAVVMLDSDLQHPPELIRVLVREWEAGADIVQTVRKDGDETGWLKRSTSRWFYSILKRLGPIRLKKGAADYRLLSRRVVGLFKADLREHNLFLRGLVNWVGYKTTFVPFEPLARAQGKSKYRASTLLNFALNGICSFSKLPLRFCIVAGLVLSVLSLLGGTIQVLAHIFGTITAPGWSSLFAAVTFFGGVQLFFLGVIGEYVSLIFDEVKARPLYLVDRRFGVMREAAADLLKIGEDRAERQPRLSAT